MSALPGLWIAGLALACGQSSGTAVPDEQDPTGTIGVETVAANLDTPWDLAWGPDGRIWVSERGGTISRIDPATGAVTKAGELEVTERSESGLMGIAFHPDFESQPWVYAVHSYSSGGIRNRLVRMRWDGHALGAPEVLISGIPGAGNHNGSRIVVGPDRLLYMTTGDAGDAAQAQDRDALAGKVLRLDLDGRPASGNPFGNATWSFGHRNPQGLVFRADGALFSTEHGPSDNDEINLIEAGRNYGWPAVHGYCDGSEGSGEQAFCTANDVVEPLATWTPTIAPAGADFYTGSKFAEWNGDLLFVALNGRTLQRLTLAADDRSVASRETILGGDYGRLRDVLVAPDGNVYVATSNRDGRGRPASDDDRVLRLVR